MKIIDINHNGDFTADDVLRDGLPEKVSHMKLEGNGVTVTLIQREHGIDITINPAGTDYMHKIRTHEVSVSDTQVRVAGAHGAPL